MGKIAPNSSKVIAANVIKIVDVIGLLDLDIITLQAYRIRKPKLNATMR
jgi:hypothetical protein